MMENLISTLDTQRFGFKIAKINNWEIDIEKTLNNLRANNVKLVIARINSQEIDTINFLESLGFTLKDTQVTYRYYFDPSKSVISANTPSEVTIRDAVNSDSTDLALIAQESFANYGHYFADVKLNKERCHEIYADWARRSCTHKNVADKIFVAAANDKPVGFLSFKIFNDKEKKYAAGVLGAIAQKYRKFGIYRSLVTTGLAWGAESQHTWQEHNVLTTNFPGNRALSTLGFVITHSFITLHGWLV